jgi:hypothetical protein
MRDCVGNTSTMETVEAEYVRRVDELVGLGALQFPAVVSISQTVEWVGGDTAAFLSSSASPQEARHLLPFYKGCTCRQDAC